MLSPIAEYGDEQIRRAIENLWLLLEALCRCDMARYMEHSLQPVKASKRLMDPCECIEPRNLCGLSPLLKRKLQAHTSAQFRIVSGSLGCEESKSTVEPKWLIVASGRRRG